MKTKSRWFRLYTEAYRDPKVYRLTDKLFRFWVYCLCLAAENDGILPADEDIAFHLRIEESKVEESRDELIGHGLLDLVAGGRYRPHNWAKRQYESDNGNSTERVRKFRSQKQNRTETEQTTDQREIVAGNNDATFHETTCNNVVPFPKTTGFLRDKYPATANDAVVQKLVQIAVQEVIGAGEQPELVTDEVLLMALQQCTRPKQHSIGLYFNTVPNWFKNMAQQDEQQA